MDTPCLFPFCSALWIRLGWGIQPFTRHEALGQLSVLFCTPFSEAQTLTTHTDDVIDRRVEPTNFTYWVVQHTPYFILWRRVVSTYNTPINVRLTNNRLYILYTYCFRLTLIE